MGSSPDAGQRQSRMSDEELLRTIGDDLRSLYAEIIRQPLPPDIEAALARIDREQSRTLNLKRPAAHWTEPAFGNYILARRAMAITTAITRTA